MEDFIILVSRIMMSAFFVVYASSELLDVRTFVNHPATKRFMELLGAGGAAPIWFAYLMAGFELFCGLAVLVGFETDFFAWVLAILLLITAALAYPFWRLKGEARETAQYHFFKNMCMTAAYLMLAVTGPGRYSIDGLRGL
jgi:putative oxidoreductase